MIVQNCNFIGHEERRSVYRKGKKIGELVRPEPFGCMYETAPRWYIAWASDSAKDRAEVERQLALANQEIGR